MTGTATESMDGPEASLEEILAGYLAEKLKADGPVAIEDMTRIAVGWSHETWLFDALWCDGTGPQRRGLCLRRDPGNALLRDNSELEEQFKVLRCLEQTDIPAIHNADWRAAGLDFLGVPELGDDFARREIAKWRDFIDQSGHPGHPILIDLIGSLEANAASTDRLTLVHGAFRTGNVLIEDDRVSAVLDWELQVIGDPMYDVAYMLTELNREGTDLLSNVVPRELFFERYQEATGIEIDEDRCRYYQLLYAMRSAAFWMSAAGLYADGRNTDLRLARTEWSVTVALERAAQELGY